MYVPKGTRISVTQKRGDAGHWVLPMTPTLLLLGNDELFFWTHVVCLFRVVATDNTNICERINGK